MQNVIETDALCKRYGSHLVVDHLALTVPEGCVYGFLGPNGAGKSTTMKMLLGLVHPTGGSVELLGHTLNEANRIALLRQTGSLIESPSGYLHLTARENLSIVADLKDVDRKDISRVREIVHLTKDADRKVGQYSLGMKQRLGIAMALLGSPKLLILDEPTNGLDPNQIVEIRHLIKEIAEERTVILSTHILSEVQATCDYIRMIEEGQVVFAGTVEEFDNYIVPSTIFVSLASTPAVDELRMLPGVENAESMGGMDYRVNFSDSREAIMQIVEASVARNWQLLEIRMEKSSMDSVFAELSAKSKKH